MSEKYVEVSLKDVTDAFSRQFKSNVPNMKVQTLDTFVDVQKGVVVYKAMEVPFTEQEVAQQADMQARGQAQMEALKNAGLLEQKETEGETEGERAITEDS